MTKFPRKTLALAAVMASASWAYADDAAKPADAPAPAPAAAPAAPEAPKPAGGATLSDILGNSGIEAKGYVDMQAEYTSLLGGTAGNVYSVFQQDHTGLTLHQASITVDKLPKEGAGALINLTVGRDADIIKSYGTYSGTNTVHIDVTQAFLNYAEGPTTWQMGKYTTLAGAEVIDSSANTNITRSVLFGQIPFTHTGVRGTYALDDTRNFVFGINNGWDQFTPYVTAKTGELGYNFAAADKSESFAIAAYVGAMPPSGTWDNAASTSGYVGTPTGTRTLIDVVWTKALNEKTSVTLNGDWISQAGVATCATNPTAGGQCTFANAVYTKSATFYGLAAYVNYQINEKERVSVRGEALWDLNGWKVYGGYAGKETESNELTVTYGYLINPSLELRAEARVDSSSVAMFTSNNGTTNYGKAAILGALFKF